MLANPNPLFLTHSVTVELYVGPNDWGDPMYSAGIRLNNVRFERDKVYQGTGNSRQVIAEGVVMVYAFNQSDVNISDDWLKARVTDESGQQYLINRVISNNQDTSVDIYSWELEVI
ncbi:hypothetical protein ESZ50_08010 [Weissella muntiaci]|uniref:Capsid protein n=1 Tax=Weissella muntiaci TaxID=2508881 RepID=A0A6C2C5L7_9LACO|nr:putative minor capsid protein [Weissella muntiaci]TYC48813.1 hypothetical protein ESZ50_08010 [Weissella muntiaci]